MPIKKIYQMKTLANNTDLIIIHVDDTDCWCVGKL